MRGLAAAEIAFCLAQPDRSCVTAEVERMPHAGCDARKSRQVEVDDVPAGQDVWIEGSDAIAECGQRGELGLAAYRLFGHLALAVVDDQHFVDLLSIHRDREEASVTIGLDVERQHAWFDRDVRGTQRRVVEDPCDRLPGRGIALDCTARLDAALDEIPNGEAHICLERLDTHRMQAVTKRRHVARNLDLDPAHRCSVEGAPGDR